MVLLVAKLYFSKLTVSPEFPILRIVPLAQTLIHSTK